MNYRLLILPSSHDLHAHLNLCCAGISSRPAARLLHPPTFPTPSWLFKSEPPTSGLAATERRCRQKQVQDLASLRPRQKLFKTQRSELWCDVHSATSITVCLPLRRGGPHRFGWKNKPSESIDPNLRQINSLEAGRVWGLSCPRSLDEFPCAAIFWSQSGRRVYADVLCKHRIHSGNFAALCHTFGSCRLFWVISKTGWRRGEGGTLGTRVKLGLCLKLWG